MAKPLDDVRLAREARMDHLERDQLVELAVVRAVDRAHATGAEQLEHVVAARERPPGEVHQNTTRFSGRTNTTNPAQAAATISR